MQKTNLIYRIIGIAVLIVSVILIIKYSDIALCLTTFGQKYFSPDNHLEPQAIIKIKTYISIGILLLITLSIVFILNLMRNIYQPFVDIFQANRLFDSAICSIKRLDLYLLVISSIIGLSLISNSLIYGPKSENVIENFSSFLLLFSSIILIISITRIDRLHLSSRTQKIIVIYLLAISGIIFVVFGEEISWGQRVFDWDTAGFFKKYNYQSETNIHNLFNPLYSFIYPIVGVFSLIVLFFTWSVTKMRESYQIDFLIPHPSLFFLVFIMAIISLEGHSELYEQLLAIFIFIYSVRIFICLAFPKIDLNTKEK